MDAHAFGDGARYVLKRIGDAGVLRDHVVRVVHLACAAVHDHVLQDRAEADSVPDLGFFLGGEVYRLGVATALEVEDPGVRPAVFVVTDEFTLGIGRQGRLARPREPEEECHVSLLAYVGRAVHREDAAFGRQHEVQDREDALLDLARVGRAADQDHLALEVNAYEGLGLRAVLLGVCEESRDRDHGPVRLEGLDLLLRRTPEELARKEGLPGVLRHHVYVEAVAGVGAGVGVDDVDLLQVLDVAGGLVQKRPEGVAREGLVARAPIHRGFRDLVIYDKAVLGRAAGPLARPYDESPGTGDHALSPPHGCLDEARGWQVFVHGPDVLYPEAPQRHLTNRQIHTLPFHPV